MSPWSRRLLHQEPEGVCAERRGNAIARWPLLALCVADTGRPQVLLLPPTEYLTMSAIAGQLTRIRRARGIPRQRIAREAPISRASLDRYEKVKFPDAAALERWARALGYEIVLKPME
jgi:hypothetical protein